MYKILGWLVLLFTLITTPAYAVENRGVVTEILEENTEYQKIEVETADKEIIIVENNSGILANNIKYKSGDRVLLEMSGDAEGNEFWIITDFERRDGLALLLIMFIAITVMVARWKGVSSLAGMMFTFVILFIFVLPAISSGKNPILIASVASMIIIPVSFFMSHGISKKTASAVAGSLIALVITSLLAFIFINLTYLTGLSSEDAGMLSINREGMLNMKGLLLAGIVIGVLGVLDDITISQAGIVNELAKTEKITKASELYTRAMNVGKDHITSMVNTLVLAYAGVSLPLLLMFVDNPQPFGKIINHEMVAEEIVRTLIGSMGLIIAVPITTYIAARLMGKK